MSENFDLEGFEQEVERPENKKRKKLLLILLIALMSIIMLTGVLMAFFSDYIFKSGNFTTGTLNINGTYTFLLNGVETGEPQAVINNLKPGDAVVIRASVTNTGSLSAWIREIVTLEPEDDAILQYLEVYSGEYTQGELVAGGLTANRIGLTDGTATSAVRVINGIGTDAQESGEDYTYIGANNYTVSYTVYFLPAALNDTQNLSFSLTVATEALQFKNNNATLPDAAWSTVSAAPTGA